MYRPPGTGADDKGHHGPLPLWGSREGEVECNVVSRCALSEEHPSASRSEVGGFRRRGGGGRGPFAVLQGEEVEGADGEGGGGGGGRGEGRPRGGGGGRGEGRGWGPRGGEGVGAEGRGRGWGSRGGGGGRGEGRGFRPRRYL